MSDIIVEMSDIIVEMSDIIVEMSDIIVGVQNVIQRMCLYGETPVLNHLKIYFWKRI